MIKVVIADDEDRVCKLIQALINWEKMELELVGTASNGNAALDLIKEKHPDILITDIRMPGCNGLELIEQARAINPELHMIIISGYAHFEYAQTAIKYGVGDYLLKPINQKELMDTLEEMKALIEEKRKNKEEFEINRLGREKDISKLRSVFIQDLLGSHMLDLSCEVI